ncbi:MAG: SsrA-binding protein SmpB [Candidatus Omnitrophica bacterium]|nr:SsrA-binding protein SmpB [Candidatus Omnitrophota bacterium]
MADKIIATNRQAHYKYTIFESFEAGIALKGTEVKSLRASQANLKDSFAKFEGSELFLYNMHIAPYEFGNIANEDPVRPRKLLLHKREIRGLIGEISSKKLTLIPLKLYFKHGIVKVELGLAKGKRLYDKRHVIRTREAERELKRAMKKR